MQRLQPAVRSRMGRRAPLQRSPFERCKGEEPYRNLCLQQQLQQPGELFFALAEATDEMRAQPPRPEAGTVEEQAKLLLKIPAFVPFIELCRRRVKGDGEPLRPCLKKDRRLTRGAHGNREGER